MHRAGVLPLFNPASSFSEDLVFSEDFSCSDPYTYSEGLSVCLPSLSVSTLLMLMWHFDTGDLISIRLEQLVQTVDGPPQMWDGD
jgi:hypothetical protein